MTKYVIIFDLETTGLPIQPRYNKYYNYQKTQYYDSSRVVQIGYTFYKITKDKYEYISEHEYMIKPNDFIIQNAKIHGITQDIANKQGIPFASAINKMLIHIKKAHLLVAHNAKFDVNVLLSEMYRQRNNKDVSNGLKIFKNIPFFCTSISTTNLIKLKYNKKKYKQPKLEELYKWLFNEKLPDGNRHTALYDAQVLTKCFIQLLKTNKFSLD